MEDKLKDLLQQRFGGHESPVDPGAWDAISSGMSAAKGETLRQAMQQKFSGHEVSVDPSVWNSISSQLGHGAAAGTGIGTGWLAAGISALVVTGGLLWYSAQSTNEQVTDATKTEQIAPEVPTNTSTTQTTTPVVETPVNVPPPNKVTENATVQQKQQTPPTRQQPAAVQPKAVASQLPPPASSSPGAQTVSSVLQQEITRVIADPKTPEPEKHEVIPPPTSSDMPEHGLTASKPAPVDHTASSSDEGHTDTEQSEQAIGEPIIHIPNVFSPNNDGINDRLEISATGVGGRVLVRVFSAKTEALVFTSSTVDTSWDGRDLSGTPCDEGFYFYAIELVGQDGRTYTKGETVRLYRQ